MKHTKRLSCMALALSSAATIVAVQAEGIIEEVMVTATKRSESIQDVPISISAFSENFIKESGITDLQELGGYAPNLNLAKSSQVANTRIAIRGVGSVGNNGIEPSVAIFIDGVYYPRPASIVGKLQDITAVEVLRGPQGTLFGRNAAMGALNIRTNKPSQERSTDISVTAGNYGYYSVGATLNGGLTDTVAGRLSLQYSDRDGYGDSTFDGAEIGAWEDVGLRGALNFELGDATEVTVRADWKKIENNGTLIDVLPESVLPVYLGRIGAVLDPSFADGIGNGPLPDVADAYDYSVHQRHDDISEDEQFGFALDIEGELENHTWRSISSYREWENYTYESAVRLPAEIFPRDTNYTTDSYSQELQLLSNYDGSFQYVAGAFFYHEEYSIDQDFNVGADFCAPAVFNQTFFANLGLGAPTASAIATGTAAFCNSGPTLEAVDGEFEQEVDSLAIFAQGTYDISERLSATLGIRWTEDEKTGSFSNVVRNPVAGPIGLNLRVNETAALDFSDSQVTWLANLRYTLSDDTMLFMTASTGYKAGGFNSEGSNKVLSDTSVYPKGRTFDSEEVTNYELGIKTKLYDRVTVNATLFRTDIENFQDRVFDGLSFIVINAGELRQQGLEVDINAQATENLSAIIGLSYLDSEFLDYRNGTNLPGFNQTITQDLAGSRNNFSPKYQFSSGVEWRADLGDDLEWFMRGEYQYVDEQNVNGQTDNNPAQLMDGYSLINARFGIADAGGKWDVTLYGRNLAEEGYCQVTFYQPLASTLQLTDPTTGNAMTRCVAGEPRTFGLTFNYHM